MCASYFDNEHFEPATLTSSYGDCQKIVPISLFAGLEDVLRYLENIKFTEGI
jgi:hypothetical protein